jgi:hypothetical protein
MMPYIFHIHIYFMDLTRHSPQLAETLKAQPPKIKIGVAEACDFDLLWHVC